MLEVLQAGANQLSHLEVGRNDFAGGLEGDDPDRGGVQQGGCVVRGIDESLLGQPALGDIVHHAETESHRAIGAAKGVGTLPEEKPPAMNVQRLHLAFPRLALIQGRSDDAVDHF